jgi:hypothetical protein
MGDTSGREGQAVPGAAGGSVGGGGTAAAGGGGGGGGGGGYGNRQGFVNVQR